MTDKNLNQLLQWAIENSDTSKESTSTTTQPARDPAKGLDPDILASLLGGPSDADLMREAMGVITNDSPECTLENKLVAWDNLEQLVEQIDNANNLEGLKLWAPLLKQLHSQEADCRMYAAWVISTAVQNNIKCQEKFLALGGIETLVTMVFQDEAQAARRKAATALSSEVRNFQPALDVLLQRLPSEFLDRLPGSKSADAADMEQVNAIVDALRASAVSG